MPRWIVPVRGAILSGAIAGLLLAGSADLHAQPKRAEADTRIDEAARALSAGDLDRAFQLATAYVKLHPAEPRARVILARVHIAAEELDAAYADLRRALEADPRNVDALFYQGLVTARLSQSQFQRLEAMAPGSPRLHQLLAESLEAQDRRQAAENEYEAALAARPDLLEALLGLAKLKRIRLACEDAIPLYEKAEAMRPTFDGAYGLGVCRSTLQDDEAAIVHYEQAIKRDPRAAVAWVGLGASLTRIRRPADAIVKLQRAIALEPGMGEAYYALGMAYQSSGDKVNAAAAFQKAEELATTPDGNVDRATPQPARPDGRSKPPG
jgi:tetratricopeptide (TPR) repeat protein